jgi:hypothetical protein
MLKLTSVLVLGVLGLFWSVASSGIQAQDTEPTEIFTLPGTCLVTPERVVAADGTVYGLPSGEPVFDLPAPIDTTLHQTSPDGRYLAGASSGLFDLTTGEVIRPLNPESPVITFSPDSRLVADRDAVYLTSTGEVVLDLTTTASDDGIEVTAYAEFLPNSDIFVRYTRMTSPTTSTSAVAYSGQDFTPIFDTRDYAAPYAFHQFNADMSLVVIGNGGVFTYPDMERVYDLSDRIGLWAYFSDDGQRLAVTSVMPFGTHSTVWMEVVDLPTASVINVFEVDVRTSSPHEVFTVAEDISTVSIVQFGVRTDGNPRYTGYHTFDTLTGELLRERVYDQWESSRGRGGLRPPLSQPVINVWESSRYTVGYLSDAVSPGVFNLETRELVLPLEGREAIHLVGDGQYVAAQNPCTVWELP